MTPHFAYRHFLIPFFFLMLLSLSCGNERPRPSFSAIKPELDSLEYAYGFDIRDSIHRFGLSKLIMSATLSDTTYIITDNLRFDSIVVYSLTHPVQYHTFPLPDNLIPSYGYQLVFKSLYNFYVLTADGLLHHYIQDHYEEAIHLNAIPLFSQQGLSINPYLDFTGETDVSLQGNMLYLPLFADFSHRAYSDSAYQRKPFPITATYDLIAERAEVKSFEIPKELIENDFVMYGAIRQFQKNKDSCIYYSACLPYVYVYAKGKTTKLECRSSFQKDSIRPLNLEDTSMTKDELMLHIQKSGHYNWLLDDPYREVYYRSFTLPLAEKREDGLYNTYKDARVAVMILNRKFESIGELLLPYGVFDVMLAAVTADGLLLSKKGGLDLSQEQLEFYCLKFH